jgi:hypothetical protein
MMLIQGISRFQEVGNVQKRLHGIDLSGQGQGLFLRSKGSRAGLLYGLSTGEFCPLPLFPSHALGARGFPHR